MTRKLLFVCMANINRSPSFQRFFEKKYPKYQVKSAGIYYGYPDVLNDELLKWADKVYVMDLEQEIFIAKHYPDCLNKVEVIGVSDQYNPDDDKLIEIIEYWISKKLRNSEVI